jgi:hypothetical protein
MWRKMSLARVELDRGQRRPCRIPNSRVFLYRMHFLPHPRQSVRVQVDRSRFSPIVSPDTRSNRTNRNSIHCTSLGKRSADMWRKEYQTQGSSFIECIFYPTLDSLSGFKWTGPDSLSNSTRASISSPIVSPDTRSNRTNRNSIHCTSLGKRSADMWLKQPWEICVGFADSC